MKRIAALAAVIIGLLAIPTAALASTSGSGPGGSGTTVSVSSGGCHIRVYGAHRHPKRQVVRLKHRHKLPVACRRLRQIPLPPPQKQCLPQTLTFSVAAGSSKMTEVSGPQLAPAEEFSYDGSTYTIMTVNPGAGQFTAFVNNFLFTDHGAAITNAIGVMACSA